MKRKARVLPSLLLLVLTATAIAQIATAPPRERVAPPPSNASAAELEQKADELRGAKSYLDALDYYQAAVKKNSTAPLWNKMGIAQLQLLRYKDAQKSFEKSIKLDRKYPEPYNNLGVVFYMEKKHKKAIKQYKKALALKDDMASFHSNLGTAYFARKDLPNAMAEYTRAMQLDPDVFEHRSAAGVAAQMSSPEDRAHYSYVLAKMYAGAGNFERALQYLRKAMEDGYKEIDKAYKDQEFAALRKDKRFEELMASKPAAIPQ